MKCSCNVEIKECELLNSRNLYEIGMGINSKNEIYSIREAMGSEESLERMVTISHFHNAKKTNT